VDYNKSQSERQDCLKDFVYKVKVEGGKVVNNLYNSRDYDRKGVSGIIKL
jgi:hypothetical protein